MQIRPEGSSIGRSLDTHPYAMFPYRTILLYIYIKLYKIRWRGIRKHAIKRRGGGMKGRKRNNKNPWEVRRIRRDTRVTRRVRYRIHRYPAEYRQSIRGKKFTFGPDTSIYRLKYGQVAWCFFRTYTRVYGVSCESGIYIFRGDWVRRLKLKMEEFVADVSWRFFFFFWNIIYFFRDKSEAEKVKN